MKVIQITIDERLLSTLDSDKEVKKAGRSAVIRRAVAEYLKKRRSAAIDEEYRRAYQGKPADPELAGWTDEGVWPEE